MRRILLVVVVAALMVISSVGYAFGAANPDSNGGQGTGQTKAQQNCGSTGFRQNQNGQDGGQTGSPNDEKQQGEAVTNCDHFWNDAGSNGPPQNP
jgi:hypothetical protein